MTNQELAELIRNRFTPFAFSCDCNGAHSDCYEVRSHDASIATYNTVTRIALWIQGLQDEVK
jgi:hypothetical protein